MKKPRRFLLSLVVIGLVMGFSLPAVAEYYTICGKEISLEGYIRQEFAFNVSETSDEKTNQPGLQSAYQIWYLDTNLEFSPKFEVRGIFRLWGDLSYIMLSDNDHFNRYFKASKKNLMWDDDFDQIFREFYLSYYSDKFMIRAGKQQIGWGEADGLRLIDVINPLDGRRDFQFYDTEGYEEVRIPKWLLKAEYYPGNIGPILDTAVEGYWNPGDVQEFGELLPPFADPHKAGGVFVPGQNPTSVQSQWGTWGVPVNFVPLPVRFYKQERSTSIDNSEFGARIKFNFKSTFMTLCFWNGFDTSDTVVFKFRGWAFDPVNGFVSPVLPIPAPGVFEFDRIFKRMKIAGFTLDRELFGVGKLVGQVADPVLRVEALYQFKKYFNTGQNFMPPDPLLLLKLTHKDQIRYMVGFDWSMRIPWINPKKSTFVSAQFFHLVTLNYEGGLEAPRPVALYSWTYPRNQFYTTLLMRTEYMNEKILPSILYVHDWHTNAAWIKSKVGFRMGNHWRPQIGYLWIKRNTSHTQPMGPGAPTISDDWKSFGIFEDRDQVWLRIEYLF